LVAPVRSGSTSPDETMVMVTVPPVPAGRARRVKPCSRPRLDFEYQTDIPRAGIARQSSWWCEPAERCRVPPRPWDASTLDPVARAPPGADVGAPPLRAGAAPPQA